MELANLVVERVVLHEVFRRGLDQVRVAPDCGEQIENLDDEATDALRDRVVTAMASPTKAVPMSITRVNENATIRHVKDLLNPNLEVYIDGTKVLANRLADEQRSRKIPGGVLVVFHGTYGAPSRRLVCIIKAEVHNGFVRVRDGQINKLQFLKNLMLTAQTKLYKVGLFIEEQEINEPENSAAGWSAYLYDESLTASNRYDAAQYFYEGFLGLGFPTSSARQTAKFHELTKVFIQNMNVAEEDKITLHNALVTYLKADQSPTVGVTAFGEAYFGDPEIHDAYARYMLQAGFPDMPVNKDLSDLGNALKSRRVTFKSNIKLSGPSEEFSKLVSIEQIDGDQAGDGQIPRWTKIIVKDRIQNSE